MKLLNTFIILTGFFIGSISAALAENVVKVSCMSNGKQLFKAELPEGSADKNRLSIASAYPNAMCVFLKVDKTSAGDEMKNEVYSGITDAQSSDLSKVLSFLSSGKEVGQPYGEDFDKSMELYSKTYNAFSASNKTVNLTIGVYNDINHEDVMAYWEYIKEKTELLSQMIPIIEKVESTIVLSVENVLDQDVEEVCQEAKKYASGCVAIY